MILSVLIKILLGQLLVIGLITCVLKMILDRMLISAALRQLDLNARQVPAGDDGRLVVITHKPLGPSLRQRVQSLARGRERPFSVEYQVDPAIWGGMIILACGRRIDRGLRSRLQEAAGSR